MSVSVADRSADLLASYEAFPYESAAIPATHPDTIATAAILRGLTPPPIERCRVLELGCGTGANVIAMAFGLAGASFVGVDLSPRQIASGRRLIAELGLDNVRLEALSIGDIDDGFGVFDYIICHGVYSWVPAEIREAILRICSRNLSSDGIAYVSYNTYPGWHLRAIVRELVLFHDRADLPAPDRVSRGRQIVELAARSAPQSDPVYSAVLREELAALEMANDSYFLHEELESINEPLYFREFVGRAGTAGLRYVTEAHPSVTARALPAETRAAIRECAGDELELEQYLDFVCNRTFRQSLLCHADRMATAEPSPATVKELRLRARCSVDRSAAERPGVEVFRTIKGLTVTIEQPLVRAALHALIDARPRALTFAEVWARTSERLATMPGITAGSAGGVEELAEAMLQSALVRLIDLHVHAAPCATRVSRCPVASPLARLQAQRSQSVTSLTHLTVELSPFDQAVLLQLDGTRDHDEIVDAVHDAIVCGELVVGEGETPGRPSVVEAVGRALDNLLAVALLVA